MAHKERIELMAHSPELIIYDLDGVITDTAEFHYLAWKKLAEELGITIDRHFNEQLKGINRMDSLDRILEQADSPPAFSADEKVALATRKKGYYLELIDAVNPSHMLPCVDRL